ncbi:GDP-L-fucose synthase [Piscirickettsia litoralis]|nr:GDP-L-fucose synthase [Piscirickettsia litoralis]
MHANNTCPADFIRENLAIQQNVIESSYKNNVKRLLFLGSSCIYPRDCPQPIKEEYLLTGPLEPTNRPYALAKIAGIEMCWAHNRQYGTQYLAAMPTNLYGPGDNYDLKSSHVLPALIRKFHEAKASNAPTVEAWGTGKPRREFLYSDDMAKACVFLMGMGDKDFIDLISDENQPPLINVGYGEDVSIKELVETVKEVVGYTGDVKWNAAKPDGTPRKLMSSDKMRNMGWWPEHDLISGIRKAYQDFLGEST